jgi:hypothetical protein
MKVAGLAVERSGRCGVLRFCGESDTCLEVWRCKGSMVARVQACRTATVCCFGPAAKSCLWRSVELTEVPSESRLEPSSLPGKARIHQKRSVFARDVSVTSLKTKCEGLARIARDTWTSPP